MKFVVCTECLDWVKLTLQERTCRCGRTGGLYRSDGINAAIWGSAIALGVDNGTFAHAVRSLSDPRWRLRGERLQGVWFLIHPKDEDSHVEVFRSRRAALATPPKHAARAAGAAASDRPQARRRSR